MPLGKRLDERLSMLIICKSLLKLCYLLSGLQSRKMKIVGAITIKSWPIRRQILAWTTYSTPTTMAWHRADKLIVNHHCSSIPGWSQNSMPSQAQAGSSSGGIT